MPSGPSSPVAQQRRGKQYPTGYERQAAGGGNTMSTAASARKIRL